VAKLKKKGVANPFVCADLRDWSPLDAPPAAGANALTWNEWRMAIDAYPARVRRSVLRNAAFRLPASYAIGAAVADQLAYVSAMAHKQICMRVATNARLGGRKAHLGMLYDESCRKDWAEKAAAGVPDFAVDVEARKVCRELLTVAEQAYDRAERPARGDAPTRLFAARADRSAKPASKPSKSGGGAPPRRAKGADGAWTA
ncbi:unnamed protein product, partial [Prorocentrum cordatum]